MSKNFSVPLFIAAVTLAHVVFTDTSNTGIPYLAFFVYPTLALVQSALKRSHLKKALPAVHLSIMLWSLIAVLWHTLYLHWALTEILFIAMVIYAESIVTRKNLYSRFFKGGVLWLAGLVTVHTVLNSASGDFSYSHPSGSIMTFGILGLLFLSYFSIEENEQEQNSKIVNAERPPYENHSLTTSLPQHYHEPSRRQCTRTWRRKSAGTIQNERWAYLLKCRESRCLFQPEGIFEYLRDFPTRY